jgi:predicted SAM-dependent methyltransferase
LKLHIGGKVPCEGWSILDIEPRPEVDMVAPADCIPLGDRSCSAIYASHILEHVSLADIEHTLAEWRRVLADDGVLFVSVPDMPTLAQLYLGEADPIGRIMLLKIIYGGQFNANDFHHWGWDEELLQGYLGGAGFKCYQRVQYFGLFEDSSSIHYRDTPISLNLKASPSLPARLGA